MSITTPSSGHETFASIISEGSMTHNDVTPILIGSRSESNGNLWTVMAYLVSDLRYEHSPRAVAKWSCNTTNFVCN